MILRNKHNAKDMSNDTRSRRKVKEEEQKRRQTSGSRTTALGSSTIDTSCLRRSARETASRKQTIPSASSMRKSERIDKQSSVPSPVKRISKNVEKERVPSPLRRSERGNKWHSSSSPSSKNSSSLSDTKHGKDKSEKNVKQLVLQCNEKPDMISGLMKDKKLNARVYRSFFRPKKDDVADNNKMEGPDNICNKGLDYEDIKNEIEREKLPANHTLKEPLSNGENVEGEDHQTISCKRKRNDADMSPSACEAVANKDVADDVSLLPPVIERNSSVEICSTCFRRKRVANDSLKLECCCCSSELDQQICSPSTLTGRGAAEVSISIGVSDSSIQQKLSRNMQVNADQHTCFICKTGGKLLCCDGKGCKRSFHLGCLDPPLAEVPPEPEDWYCPWCVSKKIEFGVHSVSEGVESIWDTREVEVSAAEGVQIEKQYLVKYKGLSHVHNNWVPEAQLLSEASALLTRFRRKSQVTMWKEEWTVPHRLLQKRVLMSSKLLGKNEHTHSADTSGHYEWLVKWRGLDYEHVSWELENASFLKSPEAQFLMKDYEMRHNCASRASSPSYTDKTKMGSLLKLSKLPGEGSFGSDANYLYAINKLRECWHKGHNCVVFNDQDRMMKIVLFILSLQFNVCRPFLIISTTAALASWETEFLKLAPSINAIVYSGRKDVREIIRRFEFYGDGRCVLFRVLLSSPEAVVQDLDEIKCISWEAVIVDECLRSRLCTHFEELKIIPADWRLLLLSSQIKVSVAEYFSLLSFLGSRGDMRISNGVKTDSNENISNLKETLSRFIAYECKGESSKFVEYWVPVQLSDIQLELYCSTLLANSIALKSSSKNDQVGALRDILVSTRKCCDHPYSLDPSLQAQLTQNLKEIEVLNFGIRASGKLQLLDAILPEIRNQGLRALILFQAIGGSVRDTIGDILDDFIRLRFGVDSYERVDGVGVIPSKKQIALNKFNSKEGGRFVFLLENRACLPSIKLSSVDIVIIFNSDLNPENDMRALQKITVESHNEQIKVLRLYLPCTVEEKVLSLAKQDISLDCNMQSISRTTSHMLLMWGATFLFQKLDEFHGSNGQVFAVNLSVSHSFFDDSLQELLKLVTQKSDSHDSVNPSILKVRSGDGTFVKSIELPGELEIKLTDEKQPHVFWARILEGRCPRWKYSRKPSQRNRKRVQYAEGSPEHKDVENYSAVKKRKVDKEKLVSVDMEEAAKTNLVESEQNKDPRDAQKSLLIILKPEICKLCDVLQFPEDVKAVVERFLEYVMNNYLVNKEPASLLQAFQISLCWAAASSVKHKLDRDKSIALAREHLNFTCQDGEVDSAYSKLRFLKKLLCSSEIVKESVNFSGSKSNINSVSEKLPPGGPHSNGDDSTSMMMPERSMACQGGSGNEAVLRQDVATDFGVSKEALSGTVMHAGQNYLAQTMNLHEGQELDEIYKACNLEKAQIDNWHRIQSAFIRSMYSHNSVKADKLKLLDNEYAAKLEEHKQKLEARLKDLKEKQRALNGSKQNVPCHVREEKTKNESLAESSEQGSAQNRAVPTSGQISGEWNNDDVEDTIPRVGVAPSESDAGDVEVSGVNANTKTCDMSRDDNCENSALRNALNNGVMQHNSTGYCNSLDNVVLVDLPSSKEQNFDKAMTNEAVRSEQLEVAGVASADKVLDDTVVAGGVDCAEDSNRENNEMVFVPSSRPVVDADQHDRGAGSSSGDCLTFGAFQEPHSAQENALAEGGTLAPGRPVVESDQHNRGAGSISENSFTFEAFQVHHLAQENALANDGTLRPHQDGVQTDGDQVTSDEVEETPGHLVDRLPCESTDHGAENVGSAPQTSLSPSTNLPPGQGEAAIDRSEAVEPQPQALQNECCEPSSSLEIQGDITATGNQTAPPLSALHSQTLTSLVDHHAELPNQTVPNPLTQAFVNLAGRPERPVTDTRTPSLAQRTPSVRAQIPPPSYPDPLQNELERICKEMEMSNKILEDTKVQLKIDRDRELEDIRKKYEAKLKDVEAAFLLKKKELDDNYGKVLMNKILADAFRSKCMDIKTSGAPRSHQASPNFVQQLLQISSQQPITRPNLAAGQSSAALLGASLQAATPPIRVHNSAVSVRTSQSSSTASAAGSSAVFSDFRPPAPYSQHCGTSASLPSSSFPPLLRGTENQPTFDASASVPPRQVQPPSPPPAIWHSCQVSTNNRAQYPESAGEFAVLNSVMGIEGSPGANFPRVLPPLPDISANFDSWDLSEFGTPATLPVNPTQTGVETEVVCLSDDD